MPLSTANISIVRSFPAKKSMKMNDELRQGELFSEVFERLFKKYKDEKLSLSPLGLGIHRMLEEFKVLVGECPDPALRGRMFNLIRDITVVISKSLASLKPDDSYRFKFFSTRLMLARREFELAMFKKDVEIIKKAEDIKKLRAREPMTGLLNSIGFEREVISHLRNMRRNSLCAFGIIDIMNFKLINDTFGHLVGDEVIRTLSKIMKSQFKRSDCLARIGGDEFGFLLTNLHNNLKEAKLATDRLQKAVNHYLWFKIHPDLRVRIAIGVCVVNAEGRLTKFRKLYKEIYASADKLMYMHKQMSRGIDVPPLIPIEFFPVTKQFREAK